MFDFLVCVEIGRIPVVLRILCDGGGGGEFLGSGRADSERWDGVDDDDVLALIRLDDLGVFVI